jgi:hypothetical protein
MNYGFVCPEVPCTSRAYINIQTNMEGRPKCPKHHVHFVPELLQYPDNASIEEEEITPEQAQDLLDNAMPSAGIDVDDQTVKRYAELLRTGDWQVVTMEMGGAHHPILIRDDRLMLGTQRLLACIKANVPLKSVVVRF